MDLGSAAKRPALRTALGTRRLRLWSGLVLGLFLLVHFSNISLGLVSVDAMKAAAPWLMGPWRTMPGTVLLAGALLTHLGLALRALYLRRTLRMSGREAAQLALGLLVPLLLASHVVVARIEPALTGYGLSFDDEIRVLWVEAPLRGLQQAVLLVVVWVHACLGLWFWLRVKPWFPRLAPVLLAGALLVPLLALIGFAEAGKEVAAVVVEPEQLPPATGWLAPATLTEAILACFAALVGTVLAARGLRAWVLRRSRIRVFYPDGRTVAVTVGASVLEASRIGHIPHASMCGGRGRCSTCRIRVLSDPHRQPPPGPQEQATLARFDVGGEIRLACQLRPTHDITVFPVFAPTGSGGAGVRVGSPAATASHERELAILFCDIRGFTRRAEHVLPFDTVFVLNRYFEVVGEAVRDAGGYLDKFIGDGALALFGLKAPVDVACRQALDAAARIAEGMEALNAQLGREQTEPLSFAMGLHVGPAIVGDMGYGRAVGLTAIGDGINVASRLEGAAKDLDVEAVISSELARKAGLTWPADQERPIRVRGRTAPVEALTFARALDLRFLGSALAEAAASPR